MAGIMRGIVIDKEGRVQSGASVLITDYTTGATASLYDDIGLTGSISNPLTTNARGKWEVFVADGEYNVTASKGGVSDYDEYFRVGA